MLFLSGADLGFSKGVDFQKKNQKRRFFFGSRSLFKISKNKKL